MSYSPEQLPDTAPTPFEQASDLAYNMHGRHQSHNTLKLPLFPIEEDGIVVPVVSALSFEDSPDQDARMVGTNIALAQRYPMLKTRATYVGLWPHANKGEGTVALYNSELTFRPQDYGGTLPFRETMNALYQGYSLIEQTDEMDLRGGRQNPPPHLRGTTNTKLIPGNVGFNSVEGLRFWRPALSGEVTVEFARDRILKISDDTILTATEKTIGLTLPGDDEQTIVDGGGFHTLHQDAELFLDNETGEIKISHEGKTITPNPPYTLNPTLAKLSQLIAEQAIDQLEWEDVTHTLIMRNRREFSSQLGLNAEAAYLALHKQAIHELAEARKGLSYESVAVRAIVSQLQELRQEAISSPENLVTKRYTARDFLA